MKLTRSELKKELSRLASIINAPESVVPLVVEEPIDDVLFVILEDDQIKVMHRERGHDLVYVATSIYDDAFYWLFSRMVLSMVMSEPIGSEYTESDKRRYWFRREREMFALVRNPDWLERRNKEVREILRKIPYRD